MPPKRKLSEKAALSGGSKTKASKVEKTISKSKSVKTKTTECKIQNQTTVKSTGKASIQGKTLKEKKSYTKKISKEPSMNEAEDGLVCTAKIPTKNKKGEMVFDDWPEFRPNMTPKEVMQAGSFGGTYYRPIKSSITGLSYSGVWKELPKDWLEGLNIGKQVSSATYDEKVNTYGVKCGGSLQMWEESGWMHKQDPYGWFQWYCRFYQGRRTEDDERQIGRWLRCAGIKGRWRNNLISKCVRSGCAYDHMGVSPVVRQTLQHWGYKLTKEDYDAYAKKMAKKGL